ncbi:hypothetical protein L1987_79263 [Smallanthus sonchifolius]|uniref:Uncharacterized protein n=1 Tax=Smallanthus sonchifolius TaxID=185202 RepID=A0ACB8ZFA1_9ASTR|nr:hypothetical protein L1987_79263 [Smallanthus sonchifolius]
MYEFMTPFVSKNPRGTYLNYRDLDIGVTSGDGENSYSEGEVYGEKYFMGNFERLVKVKTAVDPDNFFRNEQSIPTLAGKTSGKSRKMMKSKKDGEDSTVVAMVVEDFLGLTLSLMMCGLGPRHETSGSALNVWDSAG